MIDRFRTLPMWRSAVLVGRSVADVLSAALCVTIVALTGLAIGWRTTASIPSVLGRLRHGPVLQLLTLVGRGCASGLISKGPESAQSFGFIVLFPLAFISNALVPTQHMPGWLQAIANWNPVSAVTAGGPASVRETRIRRPRSRPGPCSIRWRPPCSGRSPSWPSPHHWLRTSSGAAPPSSRRRQRQALHGCGAVSLEFQSVGPRIGLIDRQPDVVDPSGHRGSVRWTDGSRCHQVDHGGLPPCF